MMVAAEVKNRFPAVFLLISAMLLFGLLATIDASNSQRAMLFDLFALNPSRFDWARDRNYQNLTSPLWALFGHVFLHGGIIHLLVNFIAFIQVGPRVARRLGALRFLLLFFFSALSGAALFIALNFGAVGYAIGASGAICGVYAGYYLGRWPTIRESLSAADVQIDACVFLLINVVLFGVIRVSHVFPLAWEMNLGGFLGGALAFVLLAPRLKPGPWDSFA